MHPLLFEIPIFGGIKIYTYGVLVATAFLTGVLWTVHEAKKADENPDRILDLAFYIVLSALIGSRVLYVIVDWRRYLENPLDVLKIWEGGLVFYGGLVGAVAMSFYYMKRHHMRFLKIADLFMPGVALGHAIGRLGCLAAGCCYGKAVAGGLFSLTFPQNQFSLAPAGTPLFPIQPLESLVELIVLGVLVLTRRHRAFEGQVFLIYLILYGISRSALEAFRGDTVRGFIVPTWLSTSQFISGCIVALAVVSYVRLRRRTMEMGR